MSPVHSTTSAPPTSFVNYEQARFQDGDIVLLAIALEQANSAKETMKCQAEAMAANSVAKAKMQDGLKELQAAKDAVVEQELAAIDAQIEAVQQAKAQNLPIGQSANGEPDAFAQFAEERNLPAAAYVPANGDDPAVGDPTAYGRNLAMLQAYRESVANGTADNPALQNALENDHATQSALSNLNALGISGAIDSLGDFRSIAERGAEAVVRQQSSEVAARSALDRLANTINEAAADLEKLSESLRKDRDGILEKFKDLGQKTKSVDATRSQRILESSEDYRDFSAAVDRVDEVLARLGLGPDAVTRIFESLPAEQQAEVSRAVDHASQALQRLFDNSRPVESFIDSPRRIRV